MGKVGSERATAGIILIVVGLGLFLMQRADGIGEAAIFLVIGAAFLAGYLLRRVYGFLVPAGILLGLGAGQIGRDSFFDFGDATLLGLGCGFISIFVIAYLYERRSHWWPLIPGTILLLVGIPKAGRAFEFLFDNWPLILVVVGILVLVGAFGRRDPDRSPPPDD